MISEIQSTNNLAIYYEFIDSPFGKLLFASTDKGICYLGIPNNQKVDDLQRRFPKANFISKSIDNHQTALQVFFNNKKLTALSFDLKGTDFQIKVWNALLQIPFGDTTTYGKIASTINNPKASQAVGTAIGNNPISLLIPCHRVLQTSGGIGGYMWGKEIKTTILDFEKGLMP